MPNVEHIPFCSVFPCFVPGCRFVPSKIAAAALRPRNDMTERFYGKTKRFSERNVLNLSRSDTTILQSSIFSLHTQKTPGSCRESEFITLHDIFAWEALIQSKERSARDYVFKPIRWGKRPAERRSCLIQRFPGLSLFRSAVRRLFVRRTDFCIAIRLHCLQNTPRHPTSARSPSETDRRLL